jgi:hypothetical protein
MMKYTLIALGLMAFAGCGGGGDTLTQEQTMQALTAMGSAAGVSLASANSEVTVTSGQVTVNSSATCQAGGSARASGQIIVNASNDYQYQLDVSMTSCAVGNITMNGQLDTTGTFTAQGSSLTLQGQVTFSGGITGTCVIDLRLTVDSQAGRITYNGRACGRTVNVEIGSQQ